MPLYIGDHVKFYDQCAAVVHSAGMELRRVKGQDKEGG